MALSNNSFPQPRNTPRSNKQIPSTKDQRSQIKASHLQDNVRGRLERVHKEINASKDPNYFDKQSIVITELLNTGEQKSYKDSPDLTIFAEKFKEALKNKDVDFLQSTLNAYTKKISNQDIQGALETVSKHITSKEIFFNAVISTLKVKHTSTEKTKDISLERAYEILMLVLAGTKSVSAKRMVYNKDLNKEIAEITNSRVSAKIIESFNEPFPFNENKLKELVLIIRLDQDHNVIIPNHASENAKIFSKQEEIRHQQFLQDQKIINAASEEALETAKGLLTARNKENLILSENPKINNFCQNIIYKDEDFKNAVKSGNTDKANTILQTKLLNNKVPRRLVADIGTRLLSIIEEIRAQYEAEHRLEIKFAGLLSAMIRGNGAGGYKKYVASQQKNKPTEGTEQNRESKVAVEKYSDSAIQVITLDLVSKYSNTVSQFFIKYKAVSPEGFQKKLPELYSKVQIDPRRFSKEAQLKVIKLIHKLRSDSEKKYLNIWKTLNPVVTGKAALVLKQLEAHQSEAERIAKQLERVKKQDMYVNLHKAKWPTDIVAEHTSKEDQVADTTSAKYLGIYHHLHSANDGIQLAEEIISTLKSDRTHIDDAYFYTLQRVLTSSYSADDIYLILGHVTNAEYDFDIKALEDDDSSKEVLSMKKQIQQRKESMAAINLELFTLLRSYEQSIENNHNLTITTLLHPVKQTEFSHIQHRLQKECLMELINNQVYTKGDDLKVAPPKRLIKELHMLFPPDALADITTLIKDIVEKSNSTDIISELLKVLESVLEPWQLSNLKGIISSTIEQQLENNKVHLPNSPSLGEILIDKTISTLTILRNSYAAGDPNRNNVLYFLKTTLSLPDLDKYLLTIYQQPFSSSEKELLQKNISLEVKRAYHYRRHINIDNIVTSLKTHLTTKKIEILLKLLQQTQMIESNIKKQKLEDGRIEFLANMSDDNFELFVAYIDKKLSPKKISENDANLFVEAIEDTYDSAFEKNIFCTKALVSEKVSSISSKIQLHDIARSIIEEFCMCDGMPSVAFKILTAPKENSPLQNQNQLSPAVRSRLIDTFIRNPSFVRKLINAKENGISQKQYNEIALDAYFKNPESLKDKLPPQELTALQNQIKVPNSPENISLDVVEDQLSPAQHTRLVGAFIHNPENVRKLIGAKKNAISQKQYNEIALDAFFKDPESLKDKLSSEELMSLQAKVKVPTSPENIPLAEGKDQLSSARKGALVEAFTRNPNFVKKLINAKENGITKKQYNEIALDAYFKNKTAVKLRLPPQDFAALQTLANVPASPENIPLAEGKDQLSSARKGALVEAFTRNPNFVKKLINAKENGITKKQYNEIALDAYFKNKTAVKLQLPPQEFEELEAQINKASNEEATTGRKTEWITPQAQSNNPPKAPKITSYLKNTHPPKQVQTNNISDELDNILDNM